MATSQSLPPKLTSPRLARVVERLRLFRQLEESRGRKIVWISGPAGSGKTTLMASYLASRRETAAIWYRVDRGDDDPATFFFYLTHAARALRPSFEARAFTIEYQAGMEIFARNYFRLLFARLKSSHALVLDDYQEADPVGPLHEIVRIAAEEAAPGTTIFVLSRSEPPPVLARLGAGGEVARLRWEDIRLNAAEVREMSELRYTSRRLSADTLSELHRETGGWAAGLVLMLEQLQSGSEGVPVARMGSRENIFEYFAGEVLQRADPAVQGFLLRTALLGKFTGAMAAALTRHADTEQLLRDLVRRNYFTAEHFGMQRHYEYHPLFQSFLIERARRTLPADELLALRRTAADLLLAADQVDNAVAQLHEARDWQGLARVIVAQASRLIGQGRNRTLEAWLADLPEASFVDEPELWYLRGLARLPFNLLAARSDLERAYWAFKARGEVESQCRAWCAIVDTFVHAWADFRLIEPWIDEMQSHLAQHPRWPSPLVEARVTCGMFLALMYPRPDHPDMRTWAERAWQFVLSGADDDLRLKVGAHLLLYYTWWQGELARGTVLLDTMRSLVESSEVTPLAAITWSAMTATYHWMSGEYRIGLDDIVRGLAIAEQSGVHGWDPFLCAQGIFAAFSCDDTATAQAYLQRMERMLNVARPLDAAMYHYQRGWEASMRGDLVRAHEHARLALSRAETARARFAMATTRGDYARVLFQLGQREEAMALIAQSRAEGEAIRAKNIGYRSSLLEAHCRLQMGDEACGLEHLRLGLAAGRTHGFRTYVWWRNDEMARLYAKALEHDIEPHYVRAQIRHRGLQPPADLMWLEAWPWPIKVYTLGRFELRCDDQPVAAATGKGHRKPLELLKTLIAFGGRQVGVESVINVMWPDAEGDAAMQSFKVTLHRLRKLIGRESAIELAEGRLGLNPAEVWVDAWAFQQCLLEAESADRPVAPAAERVLELYRGHFLDGESDANAAVLRFREQLRGQTLRALRRCLREREQASDWPRLAELAERAVNVDEIEEDFYAALMRANLAMGRSAQALAAFDRAQLMYGALALKAPTRLANLKAQALADGTQRAT